MTTESAKSLKLFYCYAREDKALRDELDKHLSGLKFALANLKRHDEALAAYEQALRLDPSDALAWTNKGFALANLKRHDEALAAYEQVLRLDPNHTDTWNNKGFALEKLGRPKEAQQCYEQILRLDPN